LDLSWCHRQWDRWCIGWDPWVSRHGPREWRWVLRRLQTLDLYWRRRQGDRWCNGLDGLLELRWALWWQPLLRHLLGPLLRPLLWQLLLLRPLLQWLLRLAAGRCMHLMRKADALGNGRVAQTFANVEVTTAY